MVRLINCIQGRQIKWVTTYLKGIFCVGMSNIPQWNEYMNMFFEDYIHSSPMVNNFAHRREKAMNASYLNGREEDVKNEDKNNMTIIPNSWLDWGGSEDIYIWKTFLMF